MPDIEAQRRAVVEEARSWLRTPYHHMGRVKGAGVDCATLLAEVYTRAGVVTERAIPFYPPDWHLHRNAERYLDFITVEGREIDGPPLPADVAMWRFGKCYSHGAIVIDWPLVIHAYAGKGCVLEDTEKAVWLSRLSGRWRDRAALDSRPVKFFTLKSWAAQDADALDSRIGFATPDASCARQI